MSLNEFDKLEEEWPNKHNKWWWVLKLLSTVLTALLTALGVQSCM
ncbi:MAG: smalltalk protein [Bacteroidales bacterium]|nr:smalltalk protein [Bacteroidales bacterium]